jgi:hypothetical protein
MQQSQQPVATDTAPPGLAPVSRRSVLRGAGAGAAGLAVSGLLAAPALAATRPSKAASRPAGAAGAANRHDAAPQADTLVVHVRDVRTGEMDVYQGTGHVRVTDRVMAAALARAAGSSNLQRG